MSVGRLPSVLVEARKDGTVMTILPFHHSLNCARTLLLTAQRYVKEIRNLYFAEVHFVFVKFFVNCTTGDSEAYDETRRCFKHFDTNWMCTNNMK